MGQSCCSLIVSVLNLCTESDQRLCQRFPTFLRSRPLTQMFEYHATLYLELAINRLLLHMLQDSPTVAFLQPCQGIVTHQLGTPGISREKHLPASLPISRTPRNHIIPVSASKQPEVRTYTKVISILCHITSCLQ